MSDVTPDQSLHLPSLVIKNFRGIDELTIPRLGRVTLLAGKNGVGKTTVLDAVRIWADRGNNNAFDAVLRKRGESFTATNSGTTVVTPDRAALFTNRHTSSERIISIGPGGDQTFFIGYSAGSVESELAELFPAEGYPNASLRTRFGSPDVIRVPSDYEQDAVICNHLGPDGPTDDIVEHYWHDVALSPHEDRAVEALNLITNVRVERVAAVQSTSPTGRIFERRLMARLSEKDYPVPLRTLGDGALRAFAVALSLAKSTNGFLLIDEAENGIRYHLLRKI